MEFVVTKAPWLVLATVMEKMSRKVFGARPNTPLIPVDEGRVWVCTGTAPVGCTCNMTIVRVAKGVVLFSPVPAEPATVAAVTGLLGPKESIRAVVVTSTFHDSYASQWMDLFPDAFLLAPEAGIPKLSDHLQIDDATTHVLPTLGIDVLVSVPQLVVNSCEEVYALPMSSGGVGLLLGADLVNHMGAQDAWLADLSGFEGLGRARLFSVIGIVDHQEWEGILVDVLSEADNVDAVLFGHGPPLVGEGCVDLVLSAVTSPTGQIRAMRASTLLVHFFQFMFLLCALYWALSTFVW